MEPPITKEKFKQLINLKGEIRGNGIKNDVDFFTEQEGEEGLKNLEKAMKDLGYPIEYDKIKRMELYPVGVEAVTLTLIQRMFNYDNLMFQKMGRAEIKHSILVRLFMKYFLSLNRMAKVVPRMWHTYYTIGEMSVEKLDEKDGYAELILKNFHTTPLVCETFKGYLPTLVQMIVKKPVSCEERKCIHKGDDYHEFVLNW